MMRDSLLGIFYFSSESRAWYFLPHVSMARIIGSIINVGVRKYSFLTPFLHKKVDIDGIHSYN